MTVPTGSTETVTLFLDQQYDSTTWEWRKLNTTYSAVSDVTYGTGVVGSNTVTTVTYTITDGGTNDIDGVANGVIVDPTGPGVAGADTSDSGGDLAETGSVAFYAIIGGSAIVITSIAIQTLAKQKIYTRKK